MRLLKCGTSSVSPRHSLFRLFLADIIDKTDFAYIVSAVELIADETEQEKFVEAIIRSVFSMFGEELVNRASVYTPSPDNPEFLEIRWDIGVGGESRRVNKWNIGNSDPMSLGFYRGTPGTAYFEGKDRVAPDIHTDPAWHDIYEPKRTFLPYRSALNIVIYGTDQRTKFGVFCLDSLSYEFTEVDRALVAKIVSRVGWLLEICERFAGSESEEGGE